LYNGDYSEFNDGQDDETLNGDTELVKIRITNIGAVSVIVNPESFYISGLGNTIRCYETDWIGLGKLPSPLQPGTSSEVAVFRQAFEGMLNLNSLEKFARTKEWRKTFAPIEAGFKDHKGKLFRTMSFQYSAYVGAFERSI